MGLSVKNKKTKIRKTIMDFERHKEAHSEKKDEKMSDRLASL